MDKLNSNGPAGDTQDRGTQPDTAPTADVSARPPVRQFETQGLQSYDVPPDDETARTDKTDTTKVTEGGSCKC